MSRLLAGNFNVINPAINPNIGTVPDNGGNIMGLALRTFISIAIGLSFVIFFIWFLKAGLEYILAGSDKDAITKATLSIRNAIIGLVITISIYVVVWTLGTLLGINLIQFNIPTLA